MSFWCRQFPPKIERKQVNLRYPSCKVEFVRSFFGGNFSLLKRAFQLCLIVINIGFSGGFQLWITQIESWAMWYIYVVKVKKKDHQKEFLKYPADDSLKPRNSNDNKKVCTYSVSNYKTFMLPLCFCSISFILVRIIIAKEPSSFCNGQQ